LEGTGAANLEDMYAAIGSGAIRIDDMAEALDEVGISQLKLNWTTINIQSDSFANRPGVLAKLAGLISDSGGNIVRTVNNTMPDGGFYLRLVVGNLSILNDDKKAFKNKASEISGIDIKKMEIVP